MKTTVLQYMIPFIKTALIWYTVTPKVLHSETLKDISVLEEYCG